MVRLTHHDANVIAALVQFSGMPEDRRKELLAELERDDGRMVGEALFDPQKYSAAPPEVQAVVDLYRKWVENNKRLRLNREARQRSNR
jgi:hypothetical protein